MPGDADKALAKSNMIKIGVAVVALLVAAGVLIYTFAFGPTPNSPEPGSGIAAEPSEPAGGKPQKVAEAPASPGPAAPAAKPGQAPPDKRFGHSEGGRMIPLDPPKQGQ